MMNVTLFPWQSKVWRSTARVKVLSCGTGTGKSTIGALWILDQLSRKPKSTGIIAAPTYGILKSATIPVFMHFARESGIKFDYNKSDGYFAFNDGSTIWTKSMDNPASIQGIVSQYGLLDEGLLCTEDAWYTWCQRHAFYRAPQMISSTPYSLVGWTADLLELAKKGGEYEYFNAPSTDNPFFSRESFEQARRELPASIFGLRYLGVLGTPEGAVYHEFNDDNVGSIEYNPALPLYVGSDFNSSDMTWCIAQVVDNKLVVVDEIYIKYNATTKVALDELHRRYGAHKAGITFVGDATGKGHHANATLSDYEQIEIDPRFKAMNRRIAYAASNPAVQDRIACVSGLINSAANERRLLINPRCQRILLDVRQSRYKPGTRIVDKDKWDPHGADALGYTAWALFPIKPMQAVTGISTRVFR